MRRIAASIALAAAPALAQSAPTQFEAAQSAPVTPGSWVYLPATNGSAAQFDSSFRIRCDRARQVVTLERLTPPIPPMTAITIATDTLARSLPVSGSLGASDPLLDAIAYSRGRIVVTGGGGGMLVLPAWPEAARSIEDCRN